MELVEDTPDMRVPGQDWVVFSFLGPKTINGKESSIIKFRGAFAGEDQALARAREVATLDENFDVTVAKAGVWLPVPPPPGVDAEYHNEVLNQMLSREKAERLKEKAEFDKRVRKARADGSKAEKDLAEEVAALRDAAAGAKGKAAAEPAVED